MLILIVCTGFLFPACKKTASDGPQMTNEPGGIPPRNLTTGGPYPPPIEFAFGNALQPGLDCMIAFAMCGVWEPTPPYPLPGEPNRAVAPGTISANGNGDLTLDLDGFDLDPLIINQALAGNSLQISHAITLPQNATDEAFAQAGVPSPGAVTINPGSYAVSNAGNTQGTISVSITNSVPNATSVSIVINF